MSTDDNIIDEPDIRMTEDGVIKKTRDSTINLSNFIAEITGEIEIYDKYNKLINRLYVIKASIASNTNENKFEISVESFNKMNWHNIHLGSDACITHGYSNKELVRQAIQLNNKQKTITKRFSVLGFHAFRYTQLTKMR